MTRSLLVPTLVLTHLRLPRMETVTVLPKRELGLFFCTCSFNVCVRVCLFINDNDDTTDTGTLREFISNRYINTVPPDYGKRGKEETVLKVLNRILVSGDIEL